MRNAETLARGGYKLSLQFVGGSKSHAVYQNIQLPVTLLEFLEEPGNLGVIGNVAHKSLSPRERSNQIPSFLLQSLVLIGDGELGAGIVQALRDRPGNAAFVRYSEDNRDSTFKTGRHPCLLVKLEQQE